MLYLLHLHWLWLFGVVALGILVGWMTYLPRATRWADRWVRLAAAIIAVGALVALSRIVPGRSGYWLELAVVFSIVYTVGCFVGWALRDLAEFQPASEADIAASPTYLFRSQLAGLASAGSYMRLAGPQSAAGAPARPLFGAYVAGAVNVPRPGYIFPVAQAAASGERDRGDRTAAGQRKHWTWPGAAAAVAAATTYRFADDAFEAIKDGYVFPRATAPKPAAGTDRAATTGAGLLRHWTWRDAGQAGAATAAATTAPAAAAAAQPRADAAGSGLAPARPPTASPPADSAAPLRSSQSSGATSATSGNASPAPTGGASASPTEAARHEGAGTPKPAPAGAASRGASPSPASSSPGAPAGTAAARPSASTASSTAPSAPGAAGGTAAPSPAVATPATDRPASTASAADAGARDPALRSQTADTAKSGASTTPAAASPPDASRSSATTQPAAAGGNAVPSSSAPSAPAAPESPPSPASAGSSAPPAASAARTAASPPSASAGAAGASAAPAAGAQPAASSQPSASGASTPAPGGVTPSGAGSLRPAASPSGGPSGADTGSTATATSAATGTGTADPPAIKSVPNENLHPGTRPEGLVAARDNRADDLKWIRGIGPQNEGRLHGLGIWHFDQIAAWTPENVKWVGSYLAFHGRIDRERWIEQAKELAGGKTTDFSQRVAAGRVATSRDDGSHGQANVDADVTSRPRRR